MDTQEEDIYLELSELPINLALELEKYLSLNYPKNNVTIHRGPQSIYGHLPPEVQNKILKYEFEGIPNVISNVIQNTIPNTLLTTKSIKKHAVEDVYNQKCDLPISGFEIRNELERVKNLKVYDYDEDYSSTNKTQPDVMVIEFPTEYGDAGISIIDADNDYVNINFGMSCHGDEEDPNLVSIEYHPSTGGWMHVDFDIGIREGDLAADPFTEYHIRNNRNICVAYNKNYAAEYLIKWYNTIVNTNMNDEIKLEDIIYVATLNYIAIEVAPLTGYNKEIEGTKGIYNLSDQNALRTIIIPVFELSKEIIKKYIMQLTGAKLSEDDSGNLII